MRLIDADEIRIKPEYMHDICGVAMIRIEDMARILNDMPTIQSEPQWISVFDKLPEEGQVVVALEKGKTWDCMTFEGTAEWTEDERMWKKKEAVIRIDYWMPKDSALPEPYKEEGEQK